MAAKALLLVVVVAFALPGCGDDGFSCPDFCASVRDKLIEQMPDIEPEDVNCLDADFVAAGSDCDACMTIFNERWDVSITDAPCSEE